MIIGITGHKFSGKSTVTDILARQTGYEVRSFATLLKEMVCRLAGCEMVDLEDFRFKEETIVPEHLFGYCSNESHTYRSLLQGLGDLFRSKNENIFIDEVFKDSPKDIIISDCRFKNEANAIKSRGGKIIRVVRSGVASDDQHKSELEVGEVEQDVTLFNNSTMARLTQDTLIVIDILGL